MHNYFPSLIIRCLSIVSHRFLRAFSVLPTYHFRVTHGQTMLKICVNTV